ncbi:hypothetical protein ALC60_11281 [Trachymyrmex zeteki]|uniref:DNA-directed DNA polymerase n=1 Tax=Mycetomoellerius zeteki TaxID=64791 RepID=A0A151WPC0_9HYME|nr:hypothetical protein ALC60_11281 [Trachymyrmex zeteki]
MYTDTDSLIYLLECENVYENIKRDIARFDTSDYPEGNAYDIPRVNTKIPGLLSVRMTISGTSYPIRSLLYLGDIIKYRCNVCVTHLFYCNKKTYIIKTKNLQYIRFIYPRIMRTVHSQPFHVHFISSFA